MAAGDVMVSSPNERRPRMGRERVMTDAEPITIVDEGFGEPGGEDLAAQLAAETARANAAEIAATNERQGRNRAERVAARAVKTGQIERGASLASQVESATTAVEAAKNAYRMARETGDLDAEVKANTELATATARLHSAQSDFERAKASGDDPTSAGGDMTDPGGDPGGGNVDNSASVAWLAAHPRFNTDPDYKRQLIEEHQRIVRDGVQTNSPAYFRALDAKHSELEGGGRRDNADQGGYDMDGDRGGNNGGGRNGRASGGATPSRGNANGSGPGTVKTLMGPVGVSQKADGSYTVRILDQSRRADFEEGAKISNMKLGDYILEQVKIAQEREAGGSAGMITTEGQAYK